MSLFNLNNKNALITGSSKGIGKSIALNYAKLGAKVIISSRNLDACEKQQMKLIKRLVNI